MNKALVPLLLVLTAVVALPFVLSLNLKEKAVPVKTAESGADHLVIVTAHNKSVCDEYEKAFRKYYREKYQRDIVLDFRSPGGTSDIVRYIADRFEAEFRHYWNSRYPGTWRPEYAGVFCRSRNDRMDAPEENRRVRKEFLNSDIGIGIDIFAGGGTFEQSRMADCGYAVPGGAKERHPEYFEHIPQQFGGEAVYDAQGRYYGVVLSTFGICCNTDRIAELPDNRLPETWRDLADPRFFNQLSVADPSKSGSANKCFEILIQQEMADAGDPVEGWHRAMAVISRIFANARNVTDSASRVVRDVSCGDAAAAMAIDTYALSEAAFVSDRFGGKQRLAYITPAGGTAISPDPVQILRGAPNRAAAERFVDFLLSEAGQLIHACRPGVPGGPEKFSLNRPPVRQDLYQEKYLKNFALPDYNPYRSGADFHYRPELTGPYYSLIRQYIKYTMLDVQVELRRAWQAIIACGGPEKVPEAVKYFDEPVFGYDEAAQINEQLWQASTAVEKAAIYRSWSDSARKKYAAALAVCQQYLEDKK